MKTIIAFTFLIVGICASNLPKPAVPPVASRNSRFITDAIVDEIIEGIEEISEQIREDGLDPFYIQKETYVYELPVPVIFNAIAFVEEVLSTGLSDIVVNEMNYSLLWNRLDFEIELPHLHFSARFARGDVTIFGDNLNAQGDGRVDIRGTIVKGRVRVNLGIISGVSISSVTVDFNLGKIFTNIRLAIQGQNYSEEINAFISSTVPAILEEFKDEVDELIAIILLDIINKHMD